MVINILTDTVEIDGTNYISRRLNNTMSVTTTGVVIVSAGDAFAIPFAGTTVNGVEVFNAKDLAIALLPAFNSHTGDASSYLRTEGNQVATGIKNFIGELQSGGVKVATMNDISTVFRYKGYVENLPTVGMVLGDVYRVGSVNYAWNGTAWEDWGNDIDLSGYYDKEEVNDLIRAGVDDAYILNKFRPKETYTLLRSGMTTGDQAIPSDCIKIVVKSVNENGVTYYAKGMGFQKDMFHRGTGDGGVIPNASTYSVNAAFTTLTGTNIRGNGVGGVDVYRVDYSLEKIN